MIRFPACFTVLLFALLRLVLSNSDYVLCYHCISYASSLSAAKQQCAVNVDDPSLQTRWISCPKGYSCFIRSYDGEGMAAFKRSCGITSCSTGCDGQTCTYCCDSDFCNSDDTKLPTADSQLSPTEIMSIAGGAVIAVIVILGFVTLVLRRRAYRRYNEFYRNSREEYDQLGSDQQSFTSSERLLAGMPPTYNDAMEAPPPYDPKSDDGFEEYEDPPAFEDVGLESDASSTEPSTSTENLTDSTNAECD